MNAIRTIRRKGLSLSDIQPQSWLDALPVAAAIAEHDGRHVTLRGMNKSFERIWLDSDFYNGVDPRKVDRNIRQCCANESGHFAYRVLIGTGIRRHQYDVRISRMGSRADTVVGAYLFTLNDKTAEVESLENLHREMRSDSLTGLANRTGFEEEIERRLIFARAEAESRGADADTPADDTPQGVAHFAIIALDLARFSQINQCQGAIVGDELLLAVASRLSATVRRGDIVARQGSDEFLLFVRHSGEPREMDAIIQRVQAIFDTPYRLSSIEVQMDAVLGIASAPLTVEQPNDVIGHAQLALKRAKARRKAVMHYSDEALVTARRRFLLETELRAALKAGDLELAYQPLIDLDSNAPIGFEALARWNHRDRGPISPVEFIPVAEESGLIVPLGRWALRQAALTLASWDRQMGGILPVRMNVNLSAEQFALDDLANLVGETLTDSGIRGDRLTLELTESAIFTDPDRAARILHDLKGLDTHLAMDDFGTGYSNLAALQRLPIDILKIDRSFVTEMMANADKTAIVRAVISLANTLGMQTTAEGIETDELSRALAALGCNMGQGYFYARPLDEAAALQFVEQAKLKLLP